MVEEGSVIRVHVSPGPDREAEIGSVARQRACPTPRHLPAPPCEEREGSDENEESEESDGKKDGQGIAGDEDLPPLSVLLFGSEISKRSEHTGDESVRDLRECIGMCIETMKRRMGDSPAAEDAVIEWENVLRFVDGRSRRGAHVLRAGLLLFLFRESSVASYFARREPGLVRDLTERVLPLLMPRFLANMAQSPDVLVTSVFMVCTMWDGVPIGAAAPHAELGEGESGESGGQGAERARAEIPSGPA